LYLLQICWVKWSLLLSTPLCLQRPSLNLFQSTCISKTKNHIQDSSVC
jgi:hypothetical protein